MTRVGVVIPVGPEQHHGTWLLEALQSLTMQTRAADYLVLVDDMHGLKYPTCPANVRAFELYRPPWRLGVGHAFNHGVARALHLGGCDLVLMMGADDKLEPLVVERAATAYDHYERKDGYYWYDVVYEDGSEQSLPCNNAAVTAGFMRETGGLPVDASSGAMDAALISALMVHRPELLLHVPGDGGGRFWSRQHPGQETARMNRYAAANVVIRDVFTQHFAPPQWGRYD